MMIILNLFYILNYILCMLDLMVYSNEMLEVVLRLLGVFGIISGRIGRSRSSRLGYGMGTVEGDVGAGQLQHLCE